MKSGAGRAVRDSEGLGDLGWGIAREVVQNEKCSLIGREPSEPALELVPIGDCQQGIRRGRSVDRQHPQDRRSTTLARRLVDAFVDEEALYPRVEPVRIAESSKVTPGDHQRILEGILGPIDVAEDPLRDREEAVAAWTDQVDIRLPVSTLRRDDEIPIHREPLVAPCGGTVHS